MRSIALFSFICIALLSGQLNAQNKKIFFSLKEALLNPTEVYKLNLSGNDLEKLPEEIGKLTNITYLDLSNNKLTDLPKSFANLKNLKFLNLGLNSFTTIPVSIFELPELQELFIFNNYITEIPASVSNLKNLQTIDFTSNYVKALPPELFQIEQISEILCESNRIKEIPVGLQNLKFLNTLLLGDNPIAKVPAEIYKLENLKYLSIPIKNDQTVEKNNLKQSLKRTKISFNDFKGKNDPVTDSTKRNEAFNLKAKIIKGNRAEHSPVALQNIKLKAEDSNTYASTFSDNNGDFEFQNLSIDKVYTLELENQNISENENVYLARSNGEIIKTLKADENGNFVFEFLPQEIYTINVLKDEDAVLFTKHQTKTPTIITETIYFKSASSDLSNEDLSKLDNIVEKLLSDKTKQLEIISHTDSKGDDAENLSLSKKRAETVLNYIAEKGVEKSRLKATGMGEQKLLNGCDNSSKCAEEEHKINRRTEFKFF